MCAQWVAKDPWFLHADSEDPESSLGAHSLCWLCHVAAHLSMDCQRWSTIHSLVYFQLSVKLQKQLSNFIWLSQRSDTIPTEIYKAGGQQNVRGFTVRGEKRRSHKVCCQMSFESLRTET